MNLKGCGKKGLVSMQGTSECPGLLQATQLIQAGCLLEPLKPEIGGHVKRNKLLGYMLAKTCSRETTGEEITCQICGLFSDAFNIMFQHLSGG
jgi:hypothetical protein